ncbi:fumarate reductase flavoprotein subunit [Thermomonospora echinospora]|uniref:Fumarate reductase flavoprotein subunit n=1 Tax=Thermomonospora echinospora TaxID=1992 RepID=A0A1H6C174_9ACTN|nr:FAD-dependent oxidoreductase [Thermomonospora echinospora]SEG66126.1 fumarate reductase flavoprotein subunit [Thermomonospora echinospora]
MTEVLVIGAGLAGLAAAVSAAESGARVTLCEKRSEIGGSTVLSAGLSAFAGTEEQAAAGIADSTELLRHDLLETGLHRNDPALVDAYCAHQLDTYRWLRGLGVEYGKVHAASGQSVPRSHPTDTRVLVRTLLERALSRGAVFLPDTRAHRLIVEDGAVRGVLTEEGERLRADAVVLASGGFSRNPELLTRFAPQMERALRGGAAGSTGDGLLMAWKAGAGVIDTPYVKGTFGIHPDPDGAEGGTGVLAIYKGAIAVNRNGRRFVDESLPYKAVGDACLAQPDGIAFQVFDAQVMDRADPSVPIYDFAARVGNGLLLRARTLDELAGLIGVPADALRETVAAYNAAIAGRAPDEQGRTTLSGGVGTPVPITTAPFYAHPSTAVVLATYCGLTIDPSMRVLDVFGEVIDGLYAAGELVGGLHGAGYVTGTSIGKAAIFGRVAGLAASGAREERP